MLKRLPERPETWLPLGNRFSRWLGRSVIRLIGWRCEGELPNIPKLVIAAGPHTSNWDFVLALGAILGVGVRVSWLAKHTMFWGPLGRLWRTVGGIPVNRNLPVGLVDQVVKTFNENTSQVVAIMPEGTRRKVTRWKTGFLHIAYRAEVPVLVVSLDYSRKQFIVGPVLELTGDEEIDLASVQRYIGQSKGKRIHQQ